MTVVHDLAHTVGEIPTRSQRILLQLTVKDK
jgi:hypothetical protein